MPEALARVRHDSVISASPRGNNLAPRATAPKGWLRKWLPNDAKSYAGVALAAAMTGIVVNALTLQRERHPSPFFAAATAAAPVAARSATEATTAVMTPAHVAAVSPPARPSDLGGDAEPSASTRTSDSIGEMLRNAGGKDPQRLISAAQASLVKLGYIVKVSGAPGAETSAALRDFEKAHGMPISTEITPRLVKLLTSAVNASASR